MAVSLGSQNTDPEKLDDQSPSEETSPPQRSLESLRAELETGKVEKAERDRLLTEAMQGVMTVEAKAVLADIGEQKELSSEARKTLEAGTTYLLTLALYRGKDITSVQDLITEYRVAKDEPSRAFSQALIKILAHPDSESSRVFQSEIWTSAQAQSAAIFGSIQGIEEMMAEEKQEEEDEVREKKEKAQGGKDTWYGRNKDTINTMLIGGALVGGVVMLTRWLFDKKDGNKPDGEKSSLWVKLGLGTLIGAEVLGQAIGYESVQKLISGGDPKHWIYGANARGLAAAADLEFGNAMDFWTGNGPTEGEETMFTEMAEIFDISETRLWAAGKLNFDEFLKGKNSSILPWAAEGDEKIRGKIKDFYLSELEEKLPYLKDPNKRKEVGLAQVLKDGFKFGVIKELDTTDLKESDRAAVTNRTEQDEEAMKEIRRQFDHPEENIKELQETGESMLKDLTQLDGATDQYLNDLLVAFENMIGVDFDLGEDDPDEYRDLKKAREILYSFFDEVGTVDHGFFKEKQGRVKAFKVWLAKHKDEKPWSEETLQEFETYKTEMLELQEAIRASKERAEVSNLKDMAEKRNGSDVVEDMSEFAVVGLSGGLNYLNFHLEMLGEGSAAYWGITIAYGVSVGAQFADVDVLRLRATAKPVNGFGSVLWRLGPGAVIQAGVKTFETLKVTYNGTQLFRAYRYEAPELLKKVLTGEMSDVEAKTRIELAKEFQDVYKTRWLRWTRSQLTIAREAIGTYEDLGKNLDYISEMEQFFDGKKSFDNLNQPVREFLSRMKLTPDLDAGAIEEIRFTRAIKAIKSSPAFFELLERFRGSTAPLGPEAQALFDTLNPEQQRTVQEMMRDGRGEVLLGRLVSGVKAAETPKYLRSAADGSTHTYRYASIEYEITEVELTRRASDIDRARRTAGEAPVSGEEAAWNEANWSRAIQQACHEKFTTAELVRPGVYRYAGQEFSLDAAEVTRHSTSRGISLNEAAKELCIKQGVGHLTVESVRPRAGGGYEYKIGGKWISPSNPNAPSTPEHVKAMFETEMAKQGRAFDFAKFAADAKVLKFATTLERILGPVAAVSIIMHLEDAPDKRKAVCEVTAGFLTFAAGMKGAKMFDARLARYIKDPRIRLVLDLGAGLAAAYGLTEPIADLMDHYFKSVPASHAVGETLAHTFELASERMIVRSTLRSMESGIIKKGVETLGRRELTVLFEKRISGSLLRRVGTLAARNGFRQILTALGWKGVTTAALLADNATVIGVLDDVIALGLAVWMVADIINIIRLIWNAAKVEELMAERQQHEIEKMDIKDKTSRAAFQKAILPYGLTIEQALNPTEEDRAKGKVLTEEAIFDILRTLPAVRVEIVRKDTMGSEVWTITNGEAVGISIHEEPKDGQPGAVICEITDEDAGEMDEALTAMEEAEEKDSQAA